MSQSVKLYTIPFKRKTQIDTYVIQEIVSSITFNILYYLVILRWSSLKNSWPYIIMVYNYWKLNHLIWILYLDCGSKLHNCKFFRLINIKRQISKENTDEFTNRTKIMFRVLLQTILLRASTLTHHFYCINNIQNCVTKQNKT